MSGAVLHTLVQGALWVGAIGCGLMAGVYFAFSTFVMGALGSLERSAGIAAMQAINEVIVSSAFLPLFFGTTLIGLGLGGWSWFGSSVPGGGAMLAGGAIYFAGMMVCTVIGNVPLNDALAVVDPSDASASTVWTHYLSRWTLWNHIRTVASTAASVLFIVALMQRG